MLAEVRTSLDSIPVEALWCSLVAPSHDATFIKHLSAGRWDQLAESYEQNHEFWIILDLKQNIIERLVVETYRETEDLFVTSHGGKKFLLPRFIQCLRLVCYVSSMVSKIDGGTTADKAKVSRKS